MTLAELRRLCETSPELAHKIIDNEERQAIREARSEMLGIVIAGVPAVAMIGAGAYVLVRIGWWQAIVLVVVFLGVSHVLRAVLKGEFSDTSWFGRFLSGQGEE